MEGKALVESILSRHSHTFDSQRVTAGKARKKTASLKRQADYREQDRFPVTLCRLLLPTILFSRIPSPLLAHLDIHKRRNKKPRRTLFATLLTLFIHRYAVPSLMHGVHNERVII